MAPGIITPVSPPHDASAPDAHLTTKAIEHKLQKPNGTTTTTTAPAELDASRLIQTRTKAPRPVPSEAAAVAGTETTCTDHMITATWTAAHGWSAPELKPYGPLTLMPTASCLHYATQCFEGLKAYRGHDGALRLFRPSLNARRLQSSTARISLPSPDPANLVRLITALVAADAPRWLPRDRPGSFLYIRPAVIGTQPQLGVQAPSEALLLVTASFMRRLDDAPGGMALLTSPEGQARAWPGGFGSAKVGANYGPSLLATQKARVRGFGQVLWLYGPEGFCTEAGASNFFVVWRAKGDDARLQLVTAPLDDGLILDGVTRRSVLQLARERLGDELEVVERRYTVDEVLEAEREGRLVESFASGTAYFVTPVSLIRHRGKEVSFDMGNGEGGKYTQTLKKWLKDIMYGGVDHPWGVLVQEEL